MPDRFIIIDQQRGSGSLQIPIAHLFAEEKSDAAFALNLSCALDNPVLDIMPSGHINTESIMLSEGQAYPGLEAHYLPLCDGRLIDVYFRTSNLMEGVGFLVDGTGIKDKKCVVVHHKNGVSEVFEFQKLHDDVRLYRGLRARNVPGYGVVMSESIYLSRYVLPSGRSLKFDWVHCDTYPRLAAIHDDHGCLFKATWSWVDNQPELEQLILFPESDEQVTYICKRAGTAVTLEVTGAGVLGTTVYRLDCEGGKLNHFAIDSQHSEAGVEASTYSESLTYDKEKVSQMPSLPVHFT
ncbi:hypothetical protein D3C80_587960 [compost metagenome]